MTTSLPAFILPAVIDWSKLDANARNAVLARPAQQRADEVRIAVARIIEQVRADGDSTLRALTRRFDGCELAGFEVDAAEFRAAEAALGRDLRRAIGDAATRIERFHAAGAPLEYAVETATGVRCERILRGIDRVGLYVPAGSAPLPSTAMMLAIPARLAGCRDVILCTPPDVRGGADPAVLYTARLCGVNRVFKLGGAQAIAAMAYGSESIPRCDKLFGPGNAYVTEAKQQVSIDPCGAAIDLPAGPSEVLVIADGKADAAFVAADLLSQLEHGADSQAVLISDSIQLLSAARVEIERQASSLQRQSVLVESLRHLRLIRVAVLSEAIAISNRYAPEHLILAVNDARGCLPQVRSAGSIFLGSWAPEALGDYCSGTNHVLPTYGAARACSGLSVASFQRAITVQEVTPAGLAEIGPCAAILARAEGLDAHERAVSIRLERIAGSAP